MRKSSTGRVRRSKKQWTEILRQFESSELNARDFCRHEGLALASFQRWRRRIAPAAAAEFVELVPTPSPSAEATSWALEVALPDGVCLRFRG